MPAWAPRKGERCGAAAPCFRSVAIGTELVVVPLCRQHMTKLLYSADPAELATAWAFDVPLE